MGSLKGNGLMRKGMVEIHRLHTAISNLSPAYGLMGSLCFKERAAHSVDFTDIEVPVSPEMRSVAAKLISEFQLQFSQPLARASFW